MMLESMSDHHQHTRMPHGLDTIFALRLQCGVYMLLILLSYTLFHGERGRLLTLWCSLCYCRVVSGRKLAKELLVMMNT